MYGTAIFNWRTWYLIREVKYLIGEVRIKFYLVEVKILKVYLSIYFNILLKLDIKSDLQKNLVIT